MNEHGLSVAALSARMDELGLSFMAAGIETFLADSRRADMTLLESLRDLVELEYSARRERTARTRLKLSGMPQPKRLGLYQNIPKATFQTRARNSERYLKL